MQYEYDGYVELFTIPSELVWSLNWLNPDFPLDNETYAGVQSPIVALGNVHLGPCGGDLNEGLCISCAEECALSLCTRQTEMSVVNDSTDTKFIDEHFGCLSQVHNDRGTLSSTLCWQAGKLCGDDELVDTTSSSAPGLDVDFCSDGIVLHAETYSGTVERRLMARLTGNQTFTWTSSNGNDYDERRTTVSSFIMDYINTNGLGPVLAGVAASLTQQAHLANTSQTEFGTVGTTEKFVAIDWPWLIYPATLVLGAIVLLALTALHSHQCGLKTWKSSMLLLLYRTLDPDLVARQPVLHDVSTMTGVAGKAKVKLVETSREDGVVLTQ